MELPIGCMHIRPCAVDGCAEQQRSVGYCYRHAAWHYKYGMTADQINAAEAAVVCQITGRPLDATTKVIDHDHATGQFRGVIHRSVNSALGLLLHDPTALRAAADYLEDKI